ncbi:MAG: DUF2157 domain-containing protein [Alphaproteobacteria bacterium]|nr:DUF2157 domain-containing protein [Alphaproteobacteria bacterium]
MLSEQNIATPDWVEACFRKGLITEEQRNAALDRLNPHDRWRLWIGRMLSATGGSLILAAILYFYAFNWAVLTPLMKLGSVELGIALCLIAALALDVSKPAGQYLLTAAAFLVGVFLAVFGQIYQTGADAYQLFVAWAIFIAGWTVVGRNAPLWALWLVVANTGLAMWLEQEFAWNDPLMHWAPMLFVGFNLPFLLTGEVLHRNGGQWLAAPWLRMALLMVITFSASIPVAEWLLNFNSHYVRDSYELLWLRGIIGAGVLGGLFYLYRFIIPRIRAVSLLVFAGAIHALILIFELIPMRAEAAYLFGGFIILGVFAVMMRYLRKTAKEMEANHA